MWNVSIHFADSFRAKFKFRNQQPFSENLIEFCVTFSILTAMSFLYTKLAIMCDEE